MVSRWPSFRVRNSKSVAEALAVADDGADFDGIGREGQGNFESDDLAGFEASGERGADAVLAHFGGASPAGAEFSGLKHFDLQAHVDGEAGKAAGKGDLGGRGIAGHTSAGSGVGGQRRRLELSFLCSTYSMRSMQNLLLPIGSHVLGRGS